MNNAYQLLITTGLTLIFSLIINSASATNNLDYRTKITSFTIKDDNSPIGYWETSIQYPELSGSSAPINVINASIAQIATKFQCDNNIGEKHFKAEITLLDKKLVSLKYSDSWYCAGMPRSDGRTGARAYALNTGETININHELKSSTAVSFMENLNAKFKKALNEKGVLNECPEPALGYFYLSDKGINFINESNTEETIQCEVDVFIKSSEVKKYLTEKSPLHQ